jgi:hypothetical protein
MAASSIRAVSAVLDVAGFVFQVAGLILAGVGLRQTWLEFRRPDERFMDPLLAVTRAVGQRVARVWAALLRRLGRPIQHVAGAGVAMGGGGAFIARGRANYGELPVHATTEDALRELDRRTRDIMNRLADLHDQHLDDTDDVRKAIDALGKRLDTEVGQLAERDRRLAVGGIRQAALGLLLAAAGLCLQWVASLAEVQRSIG